MKDGRTIREHVRSVARRDPVNGAAALADVTAGPVPPCAALAVEVFETLNTTRSVGMAGPSAITLQDIQSYSAVYGVTLTPRESRWVCSQDDAFRRVIAEMPRDG